MKSIACQLKLGDTIAIVAPGSPSTSKDLEEATAVIEQWGFKAKVFLPKKITHPFLAGTDKERISCFKKALGDRSSKLIWCLRGGYGSSRIVEELWKMKKPSQPKILVGYSDITILHALWNDKWKWPSVHGPLFENLKPGRVKLENLGELKALLTGMIEESSQTILPLNQAAKASKKIKSELAGGNLTVVQTGLGTIHQLDGNRILVFEDIGERGYRIDRMLVQMKQAGLFRKTKAIIFGSFTMSSEKDGKDYVPEVLQSFATSMKIPVYHGLSMGHGPVNRPWSFGTEAVIEKNKAEIILTVKSAVI